MRIAIWFAVTALSAWLGIYFPALWYFAGGSVVFSLICIIHGRLSVPSVSVEIKSCTVRKNQEFEAVLLLSGFTRHASAELVCTNVLTKRTQRVRLKIPPSNKPSEFSLKIKSEDCGRLEFSFEKLHIYDLCGLTYKTVSADISGSVICLPDFGVECPQTVSEYARTVSAKPSGYEISGAKEYVQGDDLRRINHKLTQRFQKPYVNEFTPDNICPLCLFFDFACESGNFSDLDSLMEKYVSCGRSLTESGTAWQGAFFDGAAYNVRRIESTEEFNSFVHTLISAESAQRSSDITHFPENITQGKVVCFTLNKVKRDNTESMHNASTMHNAQCTMHNSCGGASAAEERLSVCEVLIFSLCTVLFSSLVFSGLDVKISPVLPMVCFVLSGAVKAVSDRFSKWLALIPAVISAAVAMIFTRLRSELYFLTDRAGLILAENNHTLFFPTDEKTAEPLWAVILLTAVLSSVGALVPQRLYLLLLAACGAVFSSCFGCLSIYAVLLCVIAAVCLLADLKHSQKIAVIFGIITVAAVSAGYFAGLHDLGRNNAYSIPDCVIEAVLEDPQPMYLRERTEQGGDTAEYSDSFYWLYEGDFFPLTQTKNLSAAVGEAPRSNVTVNVKSGSLSHPLVPYGTVDSENVSADKNSLGGDYPVGNNNFYSYEVSQSYISDGLKNLSFLSENAENSAEYLKFEQLYREYVYGEFTAVSKKDSETASAMGIIVKSSAEEKLKEVKDYFARNITVDRGIGEGPQSLSQLCEVSRRGNALDYAYCAVILLRYEELPARLCGGYVIDKETAENTLPNGAVTLTAENYHYWAEYYLDGVGWLPLEVFPDYADIIETSAYSGGETAGNLSGGAAESPQSQQGTEAQKAPENASEIVDIKAEEKTFYGVIAVVSVLVLTLLFILCQRVRAFIKRRKRRSSDVLLKAKENHAQALKLLALTGRDITLPPEKLAVSLGESYEKSESVMSKAFYSDKKITADEAEKCAEFYKSARKVFCAECGTVRRIMLIVFRGIY